MTIKNSGSQLSFSEIEAEFGNNPARSLGQYRRDDPSGNFDNASPSGSSLSNLPLDTGIPTSGEIKFSNFYSFMGNITHLYSYWWVSNYFLRIIYESFDIR